MVPKLQTFATGCTFEFSAPPLLLLLFAAALSKHHGRSDHAAKASAKLLGEKNGAKMPEIRCYRNALSSP